MLSALGFILVVGSLYLLLSTMHIYLVPADLTMSNKNYIYPWNDTADYLFRVGHLHVYGIRSLFMVVIVGGSVIVLVGIVYSALALRRSTSLEIRDEWGQRSGTGDQSRESQNERGRQSLHRDTTKAILFQKTSTDQVTNTNTLVESRDSFWPSFVALSSSRMARTNHSPQQLGRGQEETLISQRSGPKTPHGETFLRARISAKDPRMFEQMGIGRWQHQNSHASLRRSASAMTFTDTASSYSCALPSHYGRDGRSVDFAAAANEKRRKSCFIPSYYFKEHDVDGRSIPEAAAVKEHGKAAEG